MRIFVLRHVDCEPPAGYLPVLAEHGPVETVRLGIDALPDLGDVDLLVSMGGPMGVNDGQDFPWVTEEVAFIAAAIDRGVPVWGVCLGAQMLAAALGAKVYRGDSPEVGVGPVTMTDEGTADPVFAQLPRRFPALHWHADTFDLPSGSVLLASSQQYRHQAFRHGVNYGLQFHLEAAASLAATWLDIPEYRDSLRDALGEQGPVILLDGLRQAEEQMLDHAATLIQRWISGLSRPTRS